MVKTECLGLTIKKKEIFKDITFQVNEGEICGLAGGNGYGKTMIMKCISGLIPYTSGEVTVNGKVIGKDLDFPPDLGLMIETPQFVENVSGYKNLKMLACYRKQIGKQEIRKCLEEVGLEPGLKIPVRKYSLGMRQRLGIAQAIMENPHILILDEPFNSLDDEAVAWFRKWLLQYKENGNMVLLSSHNKEDIHLLCDRIIRLKNGRSIENSG